MPEPVNPFLGFFLALAKRQMQFLLIIGAATIFFALFGYGVSWISFWIILATVMTLGTFYGLLWFWRTVFLTAGGGRGN